MRRELILLCHGKPDSSSGQDDYNLPLCERSKRDAQRVGSWLQQRKLIPDHILASPTKAALDTAVHACNVMGIGINVINIEKRIYRADKKALLMLLANCPSGRKRILLVGHNPALEKLLLLLSENKPKAPKKGKLFSEASLAILRTGKDWEKLDSGKALLTSLVHADDLPSKFPFFNRADKSNEWRDRPAYYYSQSAVIPYRIRNDRVEILIITSSRNKHWIVPKGVIDIGLSAQESAAKEAFEEAGVLGRVGDTLLGTYTYEKWGANCIIKVYPMEVLNVISEQERLEPERQRIWITAEQAPSYLKQKALLSMVLKLTRKLTRTGCI
ncbi:hypothetical protein MNBD_GAMMA24-653 [hydrothermal vent metagenome]|uniref:Nudix hydrolase domain-containing protein n=1 Tax=hydrothermal vent metagenome TaxID=652676 RepID=A0A3B1BGT2_9ZZZZ